MGKSKSRIFRKGKNDLLTKMSRESAIKEAVEMLDSKNNSQAYNIITMFGLSAEELLESGASYESVTAIKSILGDK